MSDEPAGHGTDAYTYAVTSDLITQIIIQGNIARQYCELQNRAGLVYSTRAMVAYTRQLIAMVKDLHPEATKGEAHG